MSKKYSLVGVDGNAYSLMGYTADAMKQCNFPKEEVDKMYEEATSGDYYNLIAVCNGYINKCNQTTGGK